jgi:hypothetical protein
MAMTDRLQSLFQHFAVSARTFNVGTLCGINAVENDGEHGQLHLVRWGEVEVRYGRNVTRVREPSLLLFPRPLAHRFITDRERGADLVCAHLGFEGGAGNPIANSLPPFLCLPLKQLHGSEAVLELMFAEAANHYWGRQALLDRLFEVVLIQVLRHLMESGTTRAGMLTGLSHPQLRKAIVAMHEEPQKEWSLQQLAGARLEGLDTTCERPIGRKDLGDGVGEARGLHHPTCRRTAETFGTALRLPSSPRRARPHRRAPRARG